MRRMLLGLVALGMVAGACGTAAESDETERDANGAVVEGGDVGVFAMQIGDCYGDMAQDLVESLEAIPCADSHSLEVFAKFDMPDGDFPGDSAIEAAVIDGCTGERFESYVGSEYASSKYWLSPLTPTRDSWENFDDREIICMVRLEEGTSTGTAKGSGL